MMKYVQNLLGLINQIANYFRADHDQQDRSQSYVTMAHLFISVKAFFARQLSSGLSTRFME